VQGYDRDGWNYLEQLKKYVDQGLTDEMFLQTVSSVLTKGCHGKNCDFPSRMEHRKAHHDKILQKLGVVTAVEMFHAQYYGFFSYFFN